MGLIGYYNKFVKNYGVILAPPTNMLKKHVFVWSDDSRQTLDTLNNAMMTTSVLALQDFIQTFVEFDASDIDVGAVLKQQGQPMAFFNHLSSHCHL